MGTACAKASGGEDTGRKSGRSESEMCGSLGLSWWKSGVLIQGEALDTISVSFLLDSEAGLPGQRLTVLLAHLEALTEEP